MTVYCMLEHTHCSLAVARTLPVDIPSGHVAHASSAAFEIAPLYARVPQAVHTPSTSS